MAAVADPSKPVYYRNPFKWCRYWAYKKPNLFYPCVMAAAMPVFLFAVTPLRQKYLFADVTEVPTEYPLPIRKRDATLTGYED